jgi:hypothetical protein
MDLLRYSRTNGYGPNGRRPECGVCVDPRLPMQRVLRPHARTYSTLISDATHSPATTRWQDDPSKQRTQASGGSLRVSDSTRAECMHVYRRALTTGLWCWYRDRTGTDRRAEQLLHSSGSWSISTSKAAQPM